MARETASRRPHPDGFGPGDVSVNRPPYVAGKGMAPTRENGCRGASHQDGSRGTREKSHLGQQKQTALSSNRSLYICRYSAERSSATSATAKVRAADATRYRRRRDRVSNCNFVAATSLINLAWFVAGLFERWTLALLTTPRLQGQYGVKPRRFAQGDGRTLTGSADHSRRGLGIPEAGLFVAALMLPCRAFRPLTDIGVCSAEVYTDRLKLATDRREVTISVHRRRSRR
jgi:hypothetical protein